MENGNNTGILPGHGIFTYADKDGVKYISAAHLREYAQSGLAELVKNLDERLKIILETDDSSAIDNFREILGFLEGITDDQRLVAKLAEIGAELQALAQRLDNTDNSLAGSLSGVSFAADAEGVTATVTHNDRTHVSIPFPMADQVQAGAVSPEQVRKWDDAPKAAFIEMWRSYGNGFDYDEATGLFTAYKSTTYALTDITYSQAKAIYNAGVMTNSNLNYLYAGTSIKTHLPSQIRWGVASGDGVFRGANSLEVVVASLLVPRGACFNGCSKLRKVLLYSPNDSRAANTDNWSGCKVLESISVITVYAHNFSLADSPLISQASLQGIINKTSAGLAAFTITVHPDVYAKLTGDTSNAAAAALTEEELAKWMQLVEDAAAKNITFTTTQ